MHEDNICVFDNHNLIKLLSFAGKIVVKVILNRSSSSLAAYMLPESQCKFRSRRDTVNQVFCLRHLQEKFGKHGDIL